MQSLKIRDNYEVIGVFVELRRSKSSCTHYSLFWQGSCLGNFRCKKQAMQCAQHVVEQQLKLALAEVSA